MQRQGERTPTAFMVGLYLLILVLAFALPYGYRLRTTGIFGCPARLYTSDVYLGYCNTTQYGDYDYGAFWFDLEPQIWSGARSADVLFVGSSRLQFGFSATATTDWFAAHHIAHYLLGFSHTTTTRFIGPLLSKLNPAAKVYVINVDRLFVDHLPLPAQEIFSDPEGVRARYVGKRAWQYLHRPLCSLLPVLCGDAPAYYRSRPDGHWGVVGGSKEFGRVPVGDGPATEQDQWPEYVRIAGEFIASLPVRRDCVVLTVVPYRGTLRGEAQAIAAGLGLDLVAPEVEGLTTFDESHLDRPSAERWSAAFLDAAGPRIARCVADGGGAAPRSTEN
jgi:hypothetical protein